MSANKINTSQPEGDIEKQTTENDSQKSHLNETELLESLRKQVEFYFSKENLMTDRYLLSQMDEDMYVPINIIAGFKMVKNLTEDLNLLIKAMKQSKVICVNQEETKVKPNTKAQRNTIFLREIPSSTDPEEIKKLFADKFESFEVKSDIGDCWYITFEDDTAALSALDHIRNKKFQEKPIRARIKTESSLKSFQLAASASTSDPSKNHINVDYRLYYPQQAPWIGRGNMNPYTEWENQNPNPSGGGHRYEGRRGGHRRSKKEYVGRGRGHRGGRDSRKRRGHGKGNAPQQQQQQQVPSLGTLNFPPLVPLSTKKTRGYTSDYIKYSREEIVEVISNMKDVTKPEDIDEKRGGIVILMEPNCEIEVTKPFPRKMNAKTNEKQAKKTENVASEK